MRDQLFQNVLNCQNLYQWSLNEVSVIWKLVVLGHFGPRKITQEKWAIFTNILNSTSSCIILYQNVPLFTFYYFQELTYFGLEVSEQNCIENHKRKISIIRKAILNYVYFSCINFYMENVPKSSFYTLPKLVTAWATTVHVTCVGTIFITFVETLFVTLIISSQNYQQYYLNTYYS